MNDLNRNVIGGIHRSVRFGISPRGVASSLWLEISAERQRHNNSKRESLYLGKI